VVVLVRYYAFKDGAKKQMKTFVNEKYFIWLYWSGTDNYDEHVR